MSKSTSKNQSYTTNLNQDYSLTTGAGDILGFQAANLGAGAGSTVNISSANAGLAAKAIDRVSGIADRATEAARGFTESSNAIASQVANSQRDFVEVASGQKTFLWGAAVLAVIAWVLFRK